MNYRANPLHGTDGQLMVMAAHRYCLGRQSYIVGSCIDWLKTWWPNFERNTVNVIVRDTVEALQDDNAGSGHDAAAWKALAQWAWDKMDDKQKSWCLQAVAHRDKPWPLT